MPDQAQPMPHDNAESLLRIPSVREACAHIWQDLSPVERQVARFIAQELRVHSDDAPIVEELQLTQIVRAMSLNLFSPLFRDHVNEQAIEGLMGVAVDMRRRQVWVDGYLLSRGLGRQEFDLLELLARNAGAVCPTLQIMQALWPDERHVETNSADGRLDGIVNRLRTALGERGRRYIVRHPRVGIQLTAGCLQGQ